MNTRGFFTILGLLVATSLPAVAQPSGELDPILKAMVREVERSQQLKLVNLDVPYFIEYGVEDARSFSVTATLGALVNKGHSHFRVPRTQLRVGSYKFDNTNYAFTDYFGARDARGELPLDNNPLAIRTYLWLATDRAYKGAVAALARKRAALKNLTVREELDDFSPVEPVRMIMPLVQGKEIHADAWVDRARALSGIFNDYPRITGSRVYFSSIRSNSYLVNSEGTLVRYPDSLAYAQIRAEAQAADGMLLRNAAVTQRLDPANMPPQVEMEAIVRKVAGDLTSLLEAPVGDSYVGPVLFEGMASAQIFAQLLGQNLVVSRQPVQEPGRPVTVRTSEFQGRLKSRVLPEWMSVVDDPTQEEWQGKPLFGSYHIDMEGVVPKPLQLVENGVLTTFLFTRQPVKDHTGTNGRARLPGDYGAKQASFGNLFVTASETVSQSGLKKKLIELCAGRDKPYGLLIRQLDFPSSASMAELRQLSQKIRQGGATQWPISKPILAYRVYPDGREELVRGLEFQRLAARLLRDIVAASDEKVLFNFMGNSAPMSLMGAGGYVTANSVVAPSVLFDEIELEPDLSDLPTLPVVPPPDLR